MLSSSAFSVHIHPAFGLVTWVVYMVGLPWMIRRSLRFNARVTSYRNVRFDFVGTTGGAFVAVTLGGLVASSRSASWHRSPAAGCGATSSTICAMATGPSAPIRASARSIGPGCCPHCCSCSAQLCSFHHHADRRASSLGLQFDPGRIHPVLSVPYPSFSLASSPRLPHRACATSSCRRRWSISVISSSATCPGSAMPDRHLQHPRHPC